jgi:peptide/nickel transport system ATP-binding protein
VARGETVGLVGESGSGKSTIAKLLTRLVDASAGQVLLDGEDVLQGRATTAFRRRVQMVFQDPFASLNPVHTVSHHLERPLRIHGHADDDCRDQVFDLLTQVGLSPAEEYVDTHTFAMSGGQRQRVAIARALAVQPDVLVADEPTSMLDVSMRMDILELLARLRDERGLGLLFITHDLAAARWLSDRILVLYAGLVMEEAPSDVLVRAPRHPYAQLLMAAAPRRDSSVHDPLPATSGTPPTINPGPGCPFAARCAAVHDRCHTETPALHPIGEHHRVRCHLLEGARP